MYLCVRFFFFDVINIRIKKFEEQRKQALGGKDGAPSNVNAKMLEQKIMEAKQLVRQELMELVPKLKEMQKLLASLDRSNITCEATMLNTLAAESDQTFYLKLLLIATFSVLIDCIYFLIE